MIILRNKKPTVYLLHGLPGSGKSTWVKFNHPDLPIVSRDIIRAELGYTNGPEEKARLNREQESKVSLEENRRIQDLIKSKKEIPNSTYKYLMVGWLLCGRCNI